ncbi:hypothetical protein FOZ63_002069, partial [Perkinsus olseni]
MSQPYTDLVFIDPVTFTDGEVWNGFSLPSVKSALALAVLGWVIFCGLCTFHCLTRRERAAHKGALEGFDPVSNIEKGQVADDGDDDTDVVGGGRRVVAKPRYPAVDYLRGLSILQVVVFHLIWALTDFDLLPSFPMNGGFNLPVTNYLYFGAIYVTTVTWMHFAFNIHPCISYF